MSSKMMRQGFTLFLCMVLVFGNVSTVFAANDMEEIQQLPQETIEEQVTETRTVTLQIVPDAEIADGDELFDAYVQRELYGYEMATFGVAARETLSQSGKILYDALKPKIQAVAQAGGETNFTFDEITGVKTVWTNTELGVTSIDDDFPIRVAFEEECDWLRVLEALLSDLPLDMYWYDKVTGASMSYAIRLSGYSNGTQNIFEKAIVNDITFSFAVSKDYSAGEAFVTTDVNKVQKAKSVAAQVVANNAGKSDYEKLLAYKNYICDAVEYNSIAAGNYGTPYGDPWQLISVFDENNNTKVVCEGYSKAFMYLCDLTDFQEDVTCYIVDGTMNGANHMWNIVTLEGKNYLADITNTDTGTVGQDGRLFMAGTTGSPATNYTFGSTRYVYSDNTKELWGTDAGSILYLAAESYQPDLCTSGHSFVYTVTNLPTEKAAGELAGVCATCQTTDTVTLPKLNKTDYTYRVVTEPTETKAGLATYTWKNTAYGEVKIDVVLKRLGAAIPGDMDGDGNATNKDVIALLWHTLFPESSPIVGNGDINGDGVITNSDVIALLWYVLFPETYPL